MEDNEKLEELKDEEEVDEVEGADESGEKDSDTKVKTTGANTTKSKNNKGGRTFTQSQVTKMMTKEKSQGRNAAFKELGIDPKDTKTINMFKAFIESQKTEEDKTAEKENEVQARLMEAEQKALFAEAKAEAMMLGVKSQYVEDVVTLALTKMTEDSDLKTLIGEFKTKYPIWFGKSDDDEDGSDDKNEKVGQKGTGSSVKNSKKKVKDGDEEKGLGARLAAQRRGSAKKFSYWDNKK